MAQIETLAGIIKLSEAVYEVTSLVNIGANIDNYEGATFIQKNGGLLMFASGNTTTFTRCTFIEEGDAAPLGADNFKATHCRFKTGCQTIFKGCRWRIGSKTTANKSDLDTQAGAACQFLYDEYNTPCYIEDINSSNSYNHLLYSKDVQVNGLVLDHAQSVGDLHFTLPNAVTENLTVVDNGGGGARQVVVLMGLGSWANNTTAVLKKLSARNVSCYAGNDTRTLKLIDPKGDIKKATDGAVSALGRLEVFRTYTADIRKASDGSALTAKCYIENTDNSTIIMDENRDSVAIELLQYFQAGGTWNVTTQNTYLRGFHSYGSNPSIKTFDVTERTDGSYIDDGQVLMTQDASVTEHTKATVDAYTTIDTVDKLYDRFCAYMEDNFSGVDIRPQKSSDTIDIGVRNIVIDKTASSVFSITGTTVTIKADTFTGNLKTTGQVSLVNGATLDGLYTDSTQDSVVTIVGVALAPADNHLYVSTDNGSTWTELSTNQYAYVADATSKVVFKYEKGDGETGDPIVSTDDYPLASSGFDNALTSFASDVGLLISAQTDDLKKVIIQATESLATQATALITRDHAKAANLQTQTSS